MSFLTFVILTVIVVVVVLIVGAAGGPAGHSSNPVAESQCPHCHAGQPGHARFCRNCGKPMGNGTQGIR
jgi:hypothetical protein